MKVVLAYKNFAANRNISHIGLGISALNTAKVLRRHRIRTDVWPIISAADLRVRLRECPADQVIVSALDSRAGAFETRYRVSRNDLRHQLPLECGLLASGSQWRQAPARNIRAGNGKS